MPNPKPKKPSVADQFSDDEMNKIKHYGQMLGGGVTPFDDAVEEALNKRDAAEEASAKKMRAAQTGGGELLGPSEMDTAAIKQRGAIQQESDTQAAVQAQQAQGAQAPIAAPTGPAGPQGSTTPFSAQKGFVGGPGAAPAQAPAAPPPPAPGPGEPPPDEGEEQGPPQ